MEFLPPVPSILVADHTPIIEEPKIMKPVESEEMSVDLPIEVSNAEYSDVEQESVPVVESEEFIPVEDDDVMDMDMQDSEQSEETSESNIAQEEEQEEFSPKKLGKFNPELVFTLTHTKTGDVMEVIGGIAYVVDKLLDMGLKASKSGLTNAVAGRTGSHCGFVITSNQPQKKVKKTKKSKKAGKKSTKKSKKAGKKSTKKSKKKTGKKAAKKVQPKKKAGKKKTAGKKKAVKKVTKKNKKKATKKVSSKKRTKTTKRTKRTVKK